MRELYFSDGREVDEVRPDLFVRRAEYAEDAVDLVNLRLALEQRIFAQQLTHDAPEAPHVDSGAVKPLAEEQLGGAVPERHHHVRVRPQRIRVLPGQAKVANLQLALVVDQHVAGLQVPVQNPVIVQVTHAAQQLQHETLHLRDRERLGHGLHQPLQVVLRELHHHEDGVQRVPHDHLRHANHVGVLHGEQYVRLPQRRERESFPFLVHLHLLQRPDRARAFITRTEHHPVGTLVDLVELLVLKHRPAPRHHVKFALADHLVNAVGGRGPVLVVHHGPELSHAVEARNLCHGSHAGFDSRRFLERRILDRLALGSIGRLRLPRLAVHHRVRRVGL